MRNTMVNVLQEDFITAAKARGLTNRALILGHAARNALLPSITNLALSFGAVLSGAYLVEIIFSYPGMGYLIEQSALQRDYPRSRRSILLLRDSGHSSKYSSRHRLRLLGPKDRVLDLSKWQAPRDFSPDDSKIFECHLGAATKWNFMLQP